VNACTSNRHNFQITILFLPAVNLPEFIFHSISFTFHKAVFHDFFSVHRFFMSLSFKFTLIISLNSPLKFEFTSIFALKSKSYSNFIFILHLILLTFCLFTI
jgi:hypothetical protein